jgi:hypothetical protein
MGRFSSAQTASLGASLVQGVMTCLSARSASARSGALKIVLIWRATSLCRSTHTTCMSLGILLRMKLTALPGHRRRDGSAGGLEPGVIVRDDATHSPRDAPDQAIEEGAPMNLGLGDGDRDTVDARLPSVVTPMATRTRMRS